MSQENNKRYQLPKEFGEKWVAALRSGHYEDTHTALALGSKIHGVCFPNSVNKELRSRIAKLGYSHDRVAKWIESNVEFNNQQPQ
jgi:hypothetical protein